MTIRLLACDLDGTLANTDAVISDESVAAIERARAEGVLVVVATGRMPFVIGHFLDRLGITDEPFITAQGALITHRDGRVLRRIPLDPQVAREGMALATALGAGMAYFTENSITVDRFVADPASYASWFGGQSQLDPNAADHLDGQLIKFMTIHDDVEAVPLILTTLREALGERADITRSWHWFVEGAAPGADKGAALAWLCRQLGVSQNEVLAIGDGGNDLTMLQWAGYSAAPADGDPTAIAAAKWTAPPLAEHPVAATLTRVMGW